MSDHAPTVRLNSEQQTNLVAADAHNRAVRTFFQGLGIDVLVAIAVTISALFLSADGWGALEWVTISFSFFKSIMQAFAAYVMRRFLDKSSLPTPTPPPLSGEETSSTK